MTNNQGVQPKAARPLYAIDQAVVYLDHHKRVQTGRVRRIEASWDSWSPEPLIVYTVSHPTYRNNRMHIAEDGIRYAAREADQ